MYQDIFGIPESETADIKIYHASGSTSNWQTWNKPRGKSMCYMLCMGSGAGGGAGLTGATNTVRGGGGGGGSGALARCIIPVMFLPDLMYIQVGLGGLGGSSSGSAGNSGSRTYISVAPKFSGQVDLLLQSGNAASGFGAGGTTGGSNAGGGAETISTDALGLVSVLGIHQYIAGRAGAASGASGGAAGVANTIFASVSLSGGGGGGTVGSGNADQTGGSVTNNSSIYQTLNGASAATGAGGILIRQPFVSYGGVGGGGSGAGTGGDGGNGAIGSGGGGGGGGITFGKGGNGGDGMVVIICW